MKWIVPVAVVSIALIGLGCKTESDPVEAEKPPLAFEGKPDTKYVGTWKTKDGISTYEMLTDGTYKLQTKVGIPGKGPMESHLNGHWGMKGDQMQFLDQNRQAVAYTVELQGDNLTLTSLGSLKAKTIMVRQK